MSSSTFLVRVVSGVVLINLFALVLAGLSLRQSYLQFQQGAEITTRNLAQALENDISGTIRARDVALFAIVDEYQRQRAAGGVDGTSLNAYIERLRSHLPHVDALRIADAQGKVIYGTGVVPGASISVADRSHFTRLRADPKGGLVFSPPQISRVNQKWIIALSRRIDQSNGTFGGIAIATIALEQFSQTFASLNVGPHGIVTLRDDQLGIVVRHPEPENIGSVVGQKAAPEPLQKMVRAGQKSGTYKARSTVDGIERTFSYRRVGNYPLLTIVGLASDDYLTEWRYVAIRLASLVLLFSLATLAAARLIYRNWKRQASSVEALAHQEAKFRTVADFTYDWEYWQGPNREILYMTPSCERVTGYSAAQFIADPGLLLRIIHPDDRPRMDRHLREIATCEDGALVDFRIVRRDGAIRAIAHHCRAVSSRNGEPMGRRVSNRDVTEQKRMEDALRDSEERWKFALEGSEEGVWDWNIRSGEALYSRRWKEMLGYGEEEISNSADEWTKRVHAEDMPGVMANIEDHIAGKTATAVAEFRMQCKDGGWKWILGRGMVAERDAEGKPLRLVGTNTDISARKLAESALQEKTAALLHSNAELEQFAYSISHDMRQPLRMVTGHLQLLERGLKDKLDQDDKENLAFALDGARRMDAMIVSLLDYSRIGRKTSSKQWMASRDSFDEALAFLAPAIKESGATISASGEWPRIFASRDELTRLFQNLIGNAVKYHAADQAPRVEVVSSMTPQLWRVSVRDHGIGIAPQQIDRLFQFFSRLQSRARFDGTGMGLALCRKIAEHHGGHVWVESEGEGLGSTFIFELPLVPAETPAGNTETEGEQDEDR
ncbi:MAG: PAS domain-containing protein [Sulfuricella sp.]